MLLLGLCQAVYALGEPMTWAHFPLIWAVVCVCWLIGGQFWKPARRYVLAVLMAGYAYWANREAKKRKVALVFLSCIGLLSLGYGEDSHLKRWCGGSETFTRVAMACLISSMFLAYSIMTHHITPLIAVTFAINIGAWQVRAGSLAKIGRYDILIEDLCRASALAVSLMIA